MNNFTLPRTRLLLLLGLLTVLTAAGLAFGLRQSQAQSAQPTPAAPVIYAEARVNVSSLNLRTGPHVSYTAVAYLMDGERVRLVGRNRAGTWAQIELYNGYRGWVNARYLQPGIDIAALPVADVGLLGITAFVTNDPIPVYAGPDALYRRVGTARPGETLALNGRDAAATWVHVYLPDGQAGWAAADSPFLLSAAINDLPIITPFLDAPPPELSALYLVYAGPDFLYEPVDNVVEGQTLGIRGRTADGRWVLVRLENGREGWIAAEIIQVAVPLDNVPVIEGIAPPQAIGWQAANAGQSAGGSATATAQATLPPTDTPAPTATGDAPPGGGKATAAATDVPATTAPTERPTRAATATRAATRTPLATATVAATATRAATATAEPSPTATNVPATSAPTIAPTATTPPQTTGDGSPTELPVVYVYAAPSDENAPILRVVPGQSVVLIGRTADSQWVQIWLPGNQQGWIRASAVQVEIDLEVLPVVEP
jgi:uncharacterized protein YgiM (DUF1202 family)